LAVALAAQAALLTTPEVEEPAAVAAPAAPIDPLAPSSVARTRPGTPVARAGSVLPTPTPYSTGGAGTVPIVNIKAIRFGEFEITTWYQAPFPEEYSRVPDGKLWICEFCLKYMKGGFQAGRHRVSLNPALPLRASLTAIGQLKCKTRHPPGDEIYRDGKVSVFEVDGRKNKVSPLIPYLKPS
jgi:hypothetical protein